MQKINITGENVLNHSSEQQMRTKENYEDENYDKVEMLNYEQVVENDEEQSARAVNERSIGENSRLHGESVHSEQLSESRQHAIQDSERALMQFKSAPLNV